jgi:hypothetical protein
MGEVKKVPTSAEVWAVIRARHRELRVFSSYSNPDGRAFGGDGHRGEMWTQYGFHDCEWPLLEAHTTWDINPESPHERINEEHKFWLLIPIADDEQ